MQKKNVLTATVKRIYDDANHLADEIGGVEYGLNILYGPPIANPSVMIVTSQGAGEDKNRQRTWPCCLLYLDSPYRFGRILQNDFQRMGRSELLRTSTVASSLVFPQWPRFADWRKQSTAQEWLEHSRIWLNDLIDAMTPKIILTYGKVTFEELTGEQKRQYELAESVYRGIPVVGCGHLVQGANLEERVQALSKLPL